MLLIHQGKADRLDKLARVVERLLADVDGALDEVYVWQKVLSDGEVSDLYGGGNGLFYRSAETFTKTGQTDFASGVSNTVLAQWALAGTTAFSSGVTSLWLNEFQLAGMVAASMGVQSALALEQVLSGRVDCICGISHIYERGYNVNQWILDHMNRKPCRETLYNKNSVYPRGYIKGWRGRI